MLLSCTYVSLCTVVTSLLHRVTFRWTSKRWTRVWPWLATHLQMRRSVSCPCGPDAHTHVCVGPPVVYLLMQCTYVHVYTCTHTACVLGEVTICCVACCSRSCFQLFKGMLVYVRNWDKAASATLALSSTHVVHCMFCVHSIPVSESPTVHVRS